MTHPTVRHHDLHEQSIFASPDAAISQVRSWWLGAISIRVSGDKLPSAAQALDFITEEAISDTCILVRVTDDERDANILFAGSIIEHSLGQSISGSRIMRIDIPYPDQIYFLNCYKKTLATNTYLGCRGYYEYPDGGQKKFDCAFFPLTDERDQVRCVLGAVHYQETVSHFTQRVPHKAAERLST